MQPLLFRKRPALAPNSSATQPMHDTWRSPRAPKRTGLVIALVTLLAALLLAEAALATLDYPARVTPDAAFLEHDSLLGWRNARGTAAAQVSDEYAVWMQFNARGERGPLRPLEKPPGTTRVLVLGDSFVEGYGVERHERFAELAEESLNVDSDDTRIEVLALGTRGYSTDQQLLWFQRFGASYSPDLVVLMFYSNDVWYNGQPRLSGRLKPYFRRGSDSLQLTNVPVGQPTPPPAPRSRMVAAKRWMRERSRLYQLAARAVKSRPRLRDLALRIGVIDNSGPVPSAFGDSIPNEYWVHRVDEPREVRAAWETTDSLVARLHRQTTFTGSDFMVFLVPDRELLAPELAPDAYALPRHLIDHDAVPRRFIDMCTRLGVRCIDPRAEFRHAAKSASRSGRSLYYTLDVHWTPAGHAAAARVLAEAIRRTQLAHAP